MNRFRDLTILFYSIHSFQQLDLATRIGHIWWAATIITASFTNITHCMSTILLHRCSENTFNFTTDHWLPKSPGAPSSTSVTSKSPAFYTHRTVMEFGTASKSTFSWRGTRFPRIFFRIRWPRTGCSCNIISNTSRIAP